MPAWAHNRLKSFPYLAVIIIGAVMLLWTGPAPAESQVIKVGVYENAPKIFTTASGAPAGIFIDILSYIADKEGWRLEFVPGSWGQGLDRLEAGQIDLMPDMAFTAEREKLYSFHRVPVLSSWFQVYAPQGSGIKSILDLNGKRIGVLERSVQEESFIRLAKSFQLKTDLISVPDYEALFELVVQKKADAAISNRFFGLTHARKYGLEDTAVIFHPSDLFFAATKGQHQKILDAIDAHLIALKKDPHSIYYQSLKNGFQRTLNSIGRSGFNLRSRLWL